MSNPYNTFAAPPGHAGEAMNTDTKDPGVVFAPGKRRRINLVAICINLFVPWFMFAAIFAAMSFSMHYQQPVVVCSLVMVGFGCVGMSGFVAVRARQRERDPMWHNFATLALLVAVCTAAGFGEMNFRYNMRPYYDIENLNDYPDVDPAQHKGQELMDAGRVVFSYGSQIDTSKAMGFKNFDMYCVAPIIHGDGAEQLAVYDFWAVGIDCCSGVSSDFRCGQFNNPHARSGLRLMRDDEIPFFRLAVQQAEKAYNLKATHPLFFTWMQDTVGEMHSWRDNGFKMYLLGIFSHFSFNLFCVVCAVVGFSKIGMY